MIGAAIPAEGIGGSGVGRREAKRRELDHQWVSAGCQKIGTPQALYSLLPGIFLIEIYKSVPRISVCDPNLWGMEKLSLDSVLMSS